MMERKTRTFRVYILKCTMIVQKVSKKCKNAQYIKNIVHFFAYFYYGIG